METDKAFQDRLDKEAFQFNIEEYAAHKSMNRTIKRGTKKIKSSKPRKTWKQ